MPDTYPDTPAYRAERQAHAARCAARDRMPAAARSQAARRVRQLLRKAAGILAEAAEHRDGCHCDLCFQAGPERPRDLLGLIRMALLHV